MYSSKRDRQCHSTTDMILLQNNVRNLWLFYKNVQDEGTCHFDKIFLLCEAMNTENHRHIYVTVALEYKTNKICIADHKYKGKWKCFSLTQVTNCKSTNDSNIH